MLRCLACVRVHMVHARTNGSCLPAITGSCVPSFETSLMALHVFSSDAEILSVRTCAGLLFLAAHAYGEGIFARVCVCVCVSCTPPPPFMHMTYVHDSCVCVCMHMCVNMCTQMSSFANAEIFAATTLLVVLGTSVLTSLAGLSLALGAFLAGLLIAETEYALQVCDTHTHTHTLYNSMPSLQLASIHEPKHRHRKVRVGSVSLRGRLLLCKPSCSDMAPATAPTRHPLPYTLFIFVDAEQGSQN